MTWSRSMAGLGLLLAWVPPPAAAEEKPRLGETTRQRLGLVLPSYDPSVRETASPKRGDEPRSAAVHRIDRTPATPREGDEAQSTELPPFLVEAPRETNPDRAKPKPLPALPRAARFKHVPAEPFETKGETERRLAQTHLSDLDRLVLNRVTLPGVGKSQAERAKEIARIDRSAEALNRLALMIEALEASGASPQEVRALREEYARMFMTRPK